LLTGGTLVPRWGGFPWVEAGLIHRAEAEPTDVGRPSK
jgi:hypothetical protein